MISIMASTTDKIDLEEEDKARFMNNLIPRKVEITDAEWIRNYG